MYLSMYHYSNNVTLNTSLLIPAAAQTISDSQPTALSYGKLQSYGTMQIASDTDGSKSEFTILTSGYGVASCTAANGLAIGYDTLKWKNNNIIHAGNISSQSVNYAASAGSVAWGNVTGKPSTFTPSSHSHDYLPLSGGTMTGCITTKTGASNNGIKLGDTYLTSIGGEVIFQNNTAIRFGGSSWDWNVWAELGYNVSNKIVYLGLAGSPYTANSQQSGGSIYTPGVSNIYIGNGTYKVWHGGDLTLSSGSSVTYTPYSGNYTKQCVTNHWLAYWNGAHNTSGSSNLQYCDRGRFGTIITKGSGDYWPLFTDSYPCLRPGSSNNWIQIGTSNSSYGIIPSTSGGAGNGHNYIGTSSWYWKYAYIDQIYGYLNGSCSGSAGSVAWSNVTDRPTNLNQFTNGPGYITSSGSCAFASNTSFSRQYSKSGAGYIDTDISVNVYSGRCMLVLYTAHGGGGSTCGSRVYMLRCGSSDSYISVTTIATSTANDGLYSPSFSSNNGLLRIYNPYANGSFLVLFTNWV